MRKMAVTLTAISLGGVAAWAFIGVLQPDYVQEDAQPPSEVTQTQSQDAQVPSADDQAANFEGVRIDVHGDGVNPETGEVYSRDMVCLADAVVVIGADKRVKEVQESGRSVSVQVGEAVAGGENRDFSKEPYMGSPVHRVDGVLRLGYRECQTSDGSPWTLDSPAQ